MRIVVEKNLDIEDVPLPKSSQSARLFPRFGELGTEPTPRSRRSARENRAWSTARLSTCIFARRVNENGEFSIHGLKDLVGRALRGHDVHVFFDSETNEWVFSDASGGELRYKHAKEISPERVVTMEVTDRRK